MRGPWDQGQGPWSAGESWDYIPDPVKYVHETHGQKDRPVAGTRRMEGEVQAKDRELSRLRSAEVKKAVPSGENAWSSY